MENNFLTIEHKTLQTEGFLKTNPVHCQRLIQHRINGITKVLSVKLIPTHLEVSIIKVNFSDDYYEKGNVYSINGNTRKQIWSDNPDMKPDFVYTTICMVAPSVLQRCFCRIACIQKCSGWVCGA